MLIKNRRKGIRAGNEDSPVLYLLNSWLISSSVCCSSRFATKRVEQGIVLGWLEIGGEGTSGVGVGLGAG